MDLAEGELRARDVGGAQAVVACSSRACMGPPCPERGHHLWCSRGPPAFRLRNSQRRLVARGPGTG
eukprot:1655227-Pyramimonas_sp.AAC.1